VDTGHGRQYLMDMVVSVSQLTGRSHLRSGQKNGEFDTPRIRTSFGSRWLLATVENLCDGAFSYKQD